MSAHPSGDDRLLYECPRCGAPPDQWCLTAGGNWAARLHIARIAPSEAAVDAARHAREDGGA